MRIFVLICTILVIGIAIVAAGPVMAFLQDCSGPTTTTFDGGGNGTSWTDGDNWDNGVPTASLCAVIPADSGMSQHFDVEIPANTSNAVCKTLTIEKDGSQKSTLTVKKGAVLTLGDGSARTSTIDGRLTVGQDNVEDGEATLKIYGDHTIQGQGGDILLKDYETVVDEKDATGDKLTLKSSNTSCSGYPESRACTLMLHGEGHIEVETDNRAYVVSDVFCLVLEENPKTGTSVGYWVAENGAELHAKILVTGACEWQLVDVDGDYTGGVISVQCPAGCVAGSGPVTILNGQLNCERPFCTTGKLTFKSIAYSGGTTEPSISAEADAPATFGQGAMATCSSCSACE